MSKKLVAFFSASGTTKKVAQMIAEEAEADLFEDRKSTRLNSSHNNQSRMPSSA